MSSNTLLRLKLKHVALATVCLPLSAFVSCIMLSLIRNFDGSTATHCKVANYLPSISAAIGGYTPQRYIWRIAIALHSSPRLLVATIYYNYYSSMFEGSKPHAYHSIMQTNFVSYILEVVSLVGLTYISSTEDRLIHEVMFTTFVASALMYFACTCALFRLTHGKHLAGLIGISYKYKVNCSLVNVSALLSAMYLYYRHNAYCEPGVYTLFAFCEYMVVLSNMGFHMTAYLDFGEKEFTLENIRINDYNMMTDANLKGS
ncbi:PREDICTED: post-GPI attachment to proteins factor 2-like [Priapulus caudatus]|uniref:Post-GPI attachment to proteins factor 2-like n=1 Tax=Priapulus caudatus TaxID=37621 RepID=A0ABM1EPS8_PRICU|nr:PREDICTED: post-GPI attachment to proteins factor 2-like [Priapulus caudatus]